MINSEIAECIQRTGRYVGVPTGESMWPLLENKTDIIVIEKFDKKPELLDVPLYIRSDGTHVLHRIVGFDDRGYVLCGDNQWNKEHGITDENIIGELKGFYRGEKYIDCKTNKKYLLYKKVWQFFIPLRREALTVVSWAYAIRRKLVGKKN